MPEVVSVANASENTPDSEIFDFIVSFEGFSEFRYWDVRQWSCGYWTKCNKWDTITKEEAKKRKIEHINWIYARNPILDKVDNPNYKKAIISFIYNVWSLTNSQRRMINNWYYCALWNNFLLYINAWWKPLEWLRRRRQRERNLLCW